jgi:hypothetical protein
LPRRHATHDRVGRHIAGNDGAGGQHGAVADLNARHHNDRVTDPDVVPDHDAIGEAFSKEGMVALRVCRVVFGTVGEPMLRRAVERMVWRTDPHLRRDRAKFSDLRVRDHATRTEIGVVAEFGVFDFGVTENLAAAADGHFAQFDGRFDDGFGELRALACRLIHMTGRPRSGGRMPRPSCIMAGAST